MKIFLIFLSFILFISLLLFASPLYSWAEGEPSARTKDIQQSSVEDEVQKHIVKGIFKIHFDENEDEEKRTIKAELVTEALKKKYCVEKVDIKNAIITGDLDFHIKDNIVNIDETGIELDEIEKRKEQSIEKVFLISAAIDIKNCQLQGNLKAGYDSIRRAFIVFKTTVSFEKITVIKKPNFKLACFNGHANFRSAKFKEKAIFQYSSFMERVSFRSAHFEKADFMYSRFNGEADFMYSKFNEAAFFHFAKFNSDTDFSRSEIKGANFTCASIKNANFLWARFNHAIFDFANIEKANFSRISLANSSLIETNLKDAIISNVNLTGSQYEPNALPHKGSLGGIKGLKKVWFKKESKVVWCN